MDEPKKATYRPNKFIMIDPNRAAKLTLPSGAWQVLMVMATSTSNIGFVDITQSQIGEKLEMQQSVVSRHIARLKANRVVTRERNKNGRMKFRINPEYIWDFKTAIRDDIVTDIRKAKLSQKNIAA